MKSVTRVVQEMVMNSHQALKDLAQKIKKPYPTLLRELNPYDKGAKLGVETLLDIMKATGEVAPLKYMANELGFDIVPKTVQASKSNGTRTGMMPPLHAAGQVNTTPDHIGKTFIVP